MLGQTLSHYRILDQVDAGGMGVVYRAQDEILERVVAIKVLPPGALGDDSSRSRFRKEALSLARINHPNIATIHEFGTHEGTDFLVTEFIPGFTLDKMLAAGPLPANEAIALGRQLAEGLAAAHEHGIVHRDIKPANLRVTTDGRLKILDFGLAQLVEPVTDLSRTVTLSATQQITGTVPYMSPEQLRGESPDLRSDIWAAGAVLYEMSTGRRPFVAGNGALLINAILNQDPERPAAVNPKVSPGLDSIIVKALEKQPGRRYQSVAELQADLERLTVGLRPAAAKPRWNWRWAAMGALLVLLAAGGITVYRVRHSRTEATPAAAQPNRNSVAVLGFRNLSGRADTAWLSTAFAEMLTTELAAGEKLLTISGENVARVKNDLSLPDTDTLAPDTLTRIRKNLGSDFVVLGSYLDLGAGSDQPVRLDLRIQDAKSGQTIAVISEKGTEGQLDQLVTRTGVQLRQRLGIGDVPSAEELAVRASLPANLPAARLYAEGLAKLRTYDALGARDLLQKAVAADPNHALSRSALSAAWSTLGYREKAREAAEQAFRLSSGLPQQDRMLAEGQYYEASNQWDKAIATYHDLFQLFPDNLEYGLKLANTQTAALKGSDALATIEALRKLPAPRRDDLRIGLAEAAAARAVADFKRQNDVARNLAQQAEAEGARFILTRALLAQCVAMRNVGDPKQAVDTCEQARKIAAASGDRGQEAHALNNIANALYDQGNLAGARKRYEDAVQINRSIGNAGAMAGALDNIASVVGDQGDLATARRYSEQALALYRETDDKMGIGETLNNMAAALVVGGDLNAAENVFEQALAIWRQTKMSSGTATALTNVGDLRLATGSIAGSRAAYQEAFDLFHNNGEKSKSAYPRIGLGDVALAAGEIGLAESNYRDGLALAREAGDKHEASIALAGLGEVARERGDLAGARQRLEEALGIRAQIGEKQAAADSLVQIANLELEESRSAEAEASARKAAQEFAAQKVPDREGIARATLARALAAQRKLAEAQKQVALARSLIAATQQPGVRLEVASAEAMVQAAQQNTSSARAIWETVRKQAADLGLARYEFPARLALAELDIRFGDAAAGRTRSASLQKDAQNKGLLLIARKAARLAG